MPPGLPTFTRTSLPTFLAPPFALLPRPPPTIHIHTHAHLAAAGHDVPYGGSGALQDEQDIDPKVAVARVAAPGGGVNVHLAACRGRSRGRCQRTREVRGGRNPKPGTRNPKPSQPSPERGGGRGGKARKIGDFGVRTIRPLKIAMSHRGACKHTRAIGCCCKPSRCQRPRGSKYSKP